MEGHSKHCWTAFIKVLMGSYGRSFKVLLNSLYKSAYGFLWKVIQGTAERPQKSTLGFQLIYSKQIWAVWNEHATVCMHSHSKHSWVVWNEHATVCMHSHSKHSWVASSEHATVCMHSHSKHSWVVWNEHATVCMQSFKALLEAS